MRLEEIQDSFLDRNSFSVQLSKYLGGVGWNFLIIYKVSFQKLLRPNPTIGFPWIWLDLVGFGRTWSDSVGFGRIWLDLVRFGLIWSDLFVFGRIWSNLVGFSRCSPWEGTLYRNLNLHLTHLFRLWTVAHQ